MCDVVLSADTALLLRILAGMTATSAPEFAASVACVCSALDRLSPIVCLGAEMDVQLRLIIFERILLTSLITRGWNAFWL